MPLDPSVLDTSETASPNVVRQKTKVAFGRFPVVAGHYAGCTPATGSAG